MKVNLHTHTFRCGHAEGTERDYIERAVQNGIELMGFSDHAPFVFPDGYQSRFRVPMDMAEDYISTLRKLREEYKDRIDIKIGFEMEYYPLYFKDMMRTVVGLGAEYVIMGEHYFRNELPEKIHVMSSRHEVTDDDLRDYVRDVCEGMRTGAFTYVAHPDVVNYKGDEGLYLSEMNKICRTSKETGVPLEMNFLGIREGRIYPREIFWKMVGEEGCSVVYGFDAHDTAAAYDGDSLEVAEKMRKDYGLKVVERPKIADITNWKG